MRGDHGDVTWCVYCCYYWRACRAALERRQAELDRGMLNTALRATLAATAGIVYALGSGSCILGGVDLPRSELQGFYS